MTTTELRDWCAREAGWQKDSVDYWSHPTLCPIPGFTHHPYPATRDGAAEAFEDLCEGWRWERCMRRWSDGETRLTWSGYCDSHTAIDIPDTGDEVHDRFKLVKACREAK